MTTFIPGYHTGLTINLIDLDIYGNVLGLSRAKNAPLKPVFGSQSVKAISGTITGTLTAGGHVAAEGPIADLFTAMAAETPLAFVIQVGEAAGPTDGGTITGNLILTGTDLNADAEGEWEWSITATFDGAIVHTPAA